MKKRVWVLQEFFIPCRKEGRQNGCTKWEVKASRPVPWALELGQALLDLWAHMPAKVALGHDRLPDVPRGSSRGRTRAHPGLELGW